MLKDASTKTGFLDSFTCNRIFHIAACGQFFQLRNIKNKLQGQSSIKGLTIVFLPKQRGIYWFCCLTPQFELSTLK